MVPESQNVVFPDIQLVDTTPTPATSRLGRVFTRIREFRMHFKLRPTSLEGGFTHRETHTVETGDCPDART
jgi:hypothetical protein